MNYEIKQGDCLEVLKTMPSESVQTCVTSPPYFGLRDYGVEGQIGLEETPQAYVAKMVEVFEEVRRVLKPDGTLWLNLGDSYAARLRQSGEDYAGKLSQSAKGQIKEGQRALPTGLKEKDLIGIPWRVAFALQEAGWWLRQDLIWAKPNPMPESVTDRCTKSHEYIFLLTKSAKYFYDAEAVKEKSQVSDKWKEPDTKYLQKTFGNGETSLKAGFNRVGVIGGDRNKRSVWNVALQPFKGAHFATFPPKLIEPCILAGSREGDTVLDPFNGAGTTGLVSLRHKRNYIGIELNPAYIEIAKKRLAEVQVNLF